MFTPSRISPAVERYSWRLAILACLILVTADLVGVVVTPDYDFSRETVSHMMTPDAGYANVLRAALMFYAVLLIPFALQVRRRFKAPPKLKALMQLGMWAHIVFMFAAALFQNDSDVSLLGLVTVNTLHDSGTVILFSAAIFTLLCAGLSAGVPHWPRHVTHSRISLLVVASMTAIFFVAVFTDFHGLTERVNSAVFMGWITMTSLISEAWEPPSKRP